MSDLQGPEEADEIDYDALLADDDAAESSGRRDRRRQRREAARAAEARGDPASSELQPDDWRGRELVWLLVLTVLAGVLRLYRIDDWSFWIDEVHTLRDGVLDSWPEFWASIEAKRPIQYLLVRWFQPLLPGAAEGSYRLVFAFFGIAAVPLMALSVRRMFGAGPALLSAAILTLSPWHIYWSQTVRGYSVVLFFGLASLYSFWLGLEKGRGWQLLVSLVFAVLAVLTHPSSATFVFAFVVYLVVLALRLVERPPGFRARSLIWFILPLLMGAVWNWGAMQTAFESYLRSKSDVLTLPHLANTTVFFVRVPVIVAALGGIYFLWGLRSRTGLLLTLFIAVPLLSLSVASFWVRVTAQYAFFMLPAWCILAGYGGWEIVRRLELRGRGNMLVRLLPIAMILAELAAQLHLYYHYRHGERPRWREAAEYVRAQLGPDDLVASTNVPCIEWYLNPNDPKVIATLRAPGKRHVHGIADWNLPRGDLQNWVEEADEREARVWIITTQPLFQEMDPDKKWDTWVRSRFFQVRRLPNWVGPKDMTVLVYRYQGKKPSTRGERR
jgi:hypothetical protein